MQCSVPYPYLPHREVLTESESVPLLLGRTCPVFGSGAALPSHSKSPLWSKGYLKLALRGERDVGSVESWPLRLREEPSYSLHPLTPKVFDDQAKR
jgi:hypothetical protein